MRVRPVINGPRHARQQTHQNEYFGDIHGAHNVLSRKDYTLFNQQRESAVILNFPSEYRKPVQPTPQSSSSPAKSASTAGNPSPSLASQTQSVGRRKMPRIKAAIRPPTITIANGRCESEPIPRESAAGSNPKLATSMVIIMGRSLA